MNQTLKGLIFVGFLAILAGSSTACLAGINVQASGPYIGTNQDVVVVVNNVNCEFDLDRNGFKPVEVGIGATVRVSFRGEENMVLTAKFFKRDEKGGKIYIGMTQDDFGNYHGRVQSWKVNRIERPYGGG